MLKKIIKCALDLASMLEMQKLVLLREVERCFTH